MSNDINQRSPEEKRQWFLNEIENNSHYNEALKGADLSNIDLSNIDFSSLNISSTLSFENSCLKGVNVNSKFNLSLFWSSIFIVISVLFNNIFKLK